MADDSGGIIGFAVLGFIGLACYGGWVLIRDNFLGSSSKECQSWAERYCYMVPDPNAKEAYRECVNRLVKTNNEPAWCREALKDLEKK